MTIKIVELMHAGIRVKPGDNDIDGAREIYSDLLGLEVDSNRPEIAGIPGFWVNLEPGQPLRQLHIFGAEGASPAARSLKEDPTRPHVAFTVEDLDAAEAELKERGIEYWIYESLVGSGSKQVFFEDKCGNMIELQQHPG